MTTSDRSVRYIRIVELHDRALAESEDEAQAAAGDFLRRLASSARYPDSSVRPLAPGLSDCNDAAAAAPASAPAGVEARRSRPFFYWGPPIGLAAAAIVTLFGWRSQSTVVVRDDHESLEPKPSKVDSVPNPCKGQLRAKGGAPWIDDFEDGDFRLVHQESRSGTWQWLVDDRLDGRLQSAFPSPWPGDPPVNQYGLHWPSGKGQQVAILFQPACYDASAYAGLRFVGKGPGRLDVTLRQVTEVPVAQGGSCVSACGNVHRSTVTLTPEEHTFDVHWQEFAAETNTDPKYIHSISFTSDTEVGPSGLWLDDVAFIEK